MLEEQLIRASISDYKLKIYQSQNAIRVFLITRDTFMAEFDRVISSMRPNSLKGNKIWSRLERLHDYKHDLHIDLHIGDSLSTPPPCSSFTNESST